ncbi:MAG: hypothetical protein KF693_09810 [Nitrospira sp.]|nr:hypothetical protein [Nitrospira sp.]
MGREEKECSSPELDLEDESAYRHHAMKLMQERSRKKGLSSGRLVHIGEKRTEAVTVTTDLYSVMNGDQ